jgi:hypothetical protein
MQTEADQCTDQTADGTAYPGGERHLRWFVAA